MGDEEEDIDESFDRTLQPCKTERCLNRENTLIAAYTRRQVAAVRAAP